MMIYSRLFLGMGITWYFEILNFALSSLELDPRWMVLTDTLNMCQVTRSQDIHQTLLLQGVWVFIIFVCTKNVWRVVTGKRKNTATEQSRLDDTSTSTSAPAVEWVDIDLTHS